jgi:glycine betaine/proline transport system substrate-binding protein
VPESDVSSIEDLAKPSVAGRMNKYIQGIGTGAAITVLSMKAIDAYGLDSTGYSFHPGTAAAWITAYEKAVAPRDILGGKNRAALVGPRKRVNLLPAKTRIAISRIDIGIEGVTEMDWLVNVMKKTPEEAALSWMGTNQGRVEDWLRGAVER